MAGAPKVRRNLRNKGDRGIAPEHGRENQVVVEHRTPLKRVGVIVAGAADEFVLAIGFSDEAGGAKRGDHPVTGAERREWSMEAEGFAISHTSESHGRLDIGCPSEKILFVGKIGGASPRAGPLCRVW